jgi:integrase
VNVARGLDVKLPPVTGRRAAVREEEVPTDDQLDRIRAELPERYRLLVTLGAEIGLRSGEARGLRVRDFHALKRRVEVVQQLIDDPRLGQVPAPPKTLESRRYVPLTDDTVQEIAAHLARFRPGASGDDLIIAQENGEPLDDGRLTYNWKIACLAAEVHGHVFHSTRHRFATHLLSLGMDVISVARLMGHKTADQVLRRYGHVTADYMDRAREAMAAAKQAARSRG